MPVIEKDTGIRWVARKTIDGFASFKPIDEAKSSSYQQISKPILSPLNEFANEQPDVEWLPHEERPFDIFGKLWGDRRKLDPEDPTV